MIWLLIAALAFVLWRWPPIVVYVLAADLIGNFGSLGLRHASGRERPPSRFAEPEPLVRVPDNPSLPSGHATTSFACAALLAWLTPLPKIPLFTLAALIAFSRVYVGVHYPIDVIAGAAFGLSVATALRLLARGRRRSAPAMR